MSNNLIWKAQPIFISSTFSDMNAERDVLRDIVTIDLQDMLNERRVRLEPIDFRWGIDTSDEKEKEQKELMVLKVCLEDIDRSDPFFIGLIGDRYGWVPPEKRMKDAEMEKGFESKLKDKSVTALEIEYGVLASKKQLKRSFFFFREPLPYNEMPEDVKTLYHDNDPENQNLLKELKEEIVRSVGEDRVFTYKAGWDSTTNTVNKITGLKDFKEKVAEILWQEIDVETKALERTRPKTWEEEEQIYLQDFIADRVISFEGRENVINELKEFALSEADHDNIGICVAGESGSGKSALIAKLFAELSEVKEKSKDIILLAHAAGISLRSNSLDNMLTIWIKELAKELNIDVSEQFEQSAQKAGGLERQLPEHGLTSEKTKEKSKFEDLKNLFANLLTQAAENKRVVVLVDALNQFDRTEQANHLSWLPELIPANSKFIFTAIPGAETENLSKRIGMTVEKLEKIKEDDARKIIKALCDRYHKTFNKEATEILLKKQKEDGSFAYSNPLWLTMVIDDFLLMDEDDFGLMKGLEGDAEQKLSQLLIRSADKIPPDVEGMYQYVFKRCRKFGEEFVNEVLSYIGISRNGLRESDLESLIKENENIKWEALNFASFRKYLRNHIIQKGALGLWDFRHVKARESLKKSLLKEENLVVELHKNLSAHLNILKDEDPLRLTEIIWHLFKCDDKRKAADVYGSNEGDQTITWEYSATFLDILIEKETNVNWVCSMIELDGIADTTKHAIIRNVYFNLDRMMKDFVQLRPRLKLSDSVLTISKELLKRNPGSAEYTRDLLIITSNVGDIYTALGDIRAALENYESAIKISGKLCKLNPDSAEYVRDLSISYLKLGDTYTALGNTKAALEKYENSLKIREELRKRNPDSAKYARDLCFSYGRLGKIYTALGDTTTALENYENSLMILEELCKHDPDSVEYARDLSELYDNIGDIYKALGNTTTALENYENSLKITEELYKGNPDSANYARDLSIITCNIGDIYKALGNTKAALENYENSLKIAEELHKRNPAAPAYARDLSLSYDRLGDTHTSLGNTKSALQNYEISLKIAEVLSKRNPDAPIYARDVSVSYNKIGDIYEGLGNTTIALENYENSLKIQEELHKRYPDSSEYARDLSIITSNLGDIYTALGNVRAALENHEYSFKIRKELHKGNPDSADYAQDLRLSYGRLGNIYEGLGNITTALENYENSLKIAEELLKRYPDSAVYARGLILSYGNLGNINTALGNTKAALENYENSLKIAEELRNRNPDSAEYARDLVVSYYKLNREDKLIEALKYMKNKNMHMDPSFVNLCKQLGIENEQLKNNNFEDLHADSFNLESSLPEYADWVECSIFAPPMSSPGESIMIQVFAHLNEQSQEVLIQAIQYDEDAKKRGSKNLATKIKRGTELMFDLVIPTLIVKNPVESLIWNGRSESVQFFVQVPEDHQEQNIIGTLTVSQDSVPIGHIHFKLSITRNVKKIENQNIGEEAKRYNRAFISYAEEDLNEVISKVQMLSHLSISFFQDVLNLKPGDRWEQKLYKHIDDCDVFFLFWSTNAKKSEWVRKEANYALDRKKGVDVNPPEIKPVIIEKPPLEPWEELKHLHFNDALIYFKN